MQHWISTSAAAIVIGSAFAFPVGPAAAQKAMNEGGQAQMNSDQGGRGQSRGAAAESRGAPSMNQSRAAARSESTIERGQTRAQARTGAEIRGGARADTGARGGAVRGEASFRERGTVTTSRTSRDMDNRRFVERDRGFVDRDRRFVDRDRGFVDRDRRFVDRDVRSRAFLTEDDRRLNRRYVRDRSFASDRIDTRYVGGSPSFAYRSYYNEEPILHRAYGDRGYVYPPSYSSSFGLYADVDPSYDAPAYRGLYAYGGDDPTYMSADYDYTYSTPLLNTAAPACRCATYP